MNKVTRLIGLAAVGLTLGGATMGALPANAKAKSPELIYIDSESATNTSAGTQQMVTNRTVTALTQPTDQSTPVSVMIPKNTALKVVQRTAAGTVVTVPGRTQTLLIAQTSNYTYGNRAIKLTKHDYRELVKRSKAWAGKLSKRQIKVIGNYTGNGSDKLNNALRYPKRATTAKTRQRVKDLRASLKTFKLTHPMTVYRGTSNKVARLALHQKTLKPGAIYSDPGFASTSTSHAVATEFTSQVLLKINFPKGYHGAYLDPISTVRGEKEYLLNPNTKLIVTKVQRVTGQTTTTMMTTTGKKSKTQVDHEKLAYQLVTLNLLQ